MASGFEVRLRDRIPGRLSLRWLLVLVLSAFLTWQSSARGGFVNDMEAYDLNSLGAIKFRDIIISDRNIATVFWSEGLPLGGGTFSRLWYHSLLPTGKPLTGQNPPLSDSLTSTVNWIHVGSNASGKWVLVNHLVDSPEEGKLRDLGLSVWVSDTVGLYVDTVMPVGEQGGPQAYSHWGCAGVDSAGNYAVCWGNNREPEGSSVWCQLFSNNNSPRSDTIRVSDTHARPDLELRDQRNMKAAMNPGGRFIVVWQAGCDSCPPAAWYTHVFFRMYDPDGTPHTGIECATCVGDYGNVSGMYPDVAMQANGDFALVWRQYRYDCGIKIMLRRFKADGTPKGMPTIVDSSQCHMDTTPYVASDSAGNLVVAWQDDDGDGRWMADLKAKRYSPSGQQIAEEYKINDGDKNVRFVTTPVALNNNGLVGFLWGELRRSSVDGTIQQHDMMQLMDLHDVGVYLCGDANNDRVIDRKDALFLLTYALEHGQSPASLDHSDLNCDGIVDLADIVRLIDCLASGKTICTQ